MWEDPHPGYSVASAVYSEGDHDGYLSIYLSNYLSTKVCEKIPTLGTQLRVLSTVKATMMGQTMETEEDLEAMDMLVFNAQKLNQVIYLKTRIILSLSVISVEKSKQ